MKFSSQEEYGLRCLIQIARKGPNESSTIPEISQAEGLTVHHIGKIMRLLRREGFVKSVRGQSGGYSLSRPAEEIIIGDVLSAIGGRIYDAGFCGRHAGVEKHCTHTSDCSVRSLLNTLQQVLDSVLIRISLHDLLRNEFQLKTWMVEEATPKGLQLISSTK